MKWHLVVLVLCLFLHHSAGSPSAAMGATLSQKGLDYMSGVLVAMLRKSLTKISVQDVSFDSHHFSGGVKNIVCYNMHIGDLRVNLIPGVGPRVEASGISVSCHGDWSYECDTWPHIPSGDGGVSVDVSNTAASVGIDVNTSALRPNVKSKNPSCSVGHVGLSFSGGLSGWILNLLSGTIEGGVRGKLEGAVKDALAAVIDSQLNDILSGIQLSANLGLPAPFHNVEMLYGFPSNPIFAVSYASFAVQGYAVDASHPIAPSFPAPTLPAHDVALSDRFVQLLVTPYAPLSIYSLMSSRGQLHVDVTSSMLPPHAPALDTKSMSRFAPNITEYFPNATMRIRASTSGTAAMVFTEGNATFVVPVQMDFQAETASGWSSAFLLGCNMSTNLTMYVQNQHNAQSIVGDMSFLKCELNLLKSNVGVVYSTTLRIMTDVLNARVLVPAVNKMMGKGTPLPSVAGLSLTNSVVAVRNGYMVVASDFKYGG